jgi:hypothetical protein
MKFEFLEGTSFHRLVDEKTGEVTHLASYRSFTYLNGYVGYTSYYSGETEGRGGVCTADEFCKMAGTGKRKEN